MRLRLAAAVVAIVAFFGAPAAQAGSRNAFQQLLARALHARHVSPAQTGAIVLDLRTGSTLFTQNSGRSLRPASNEKLATTYAALSALGPAFRIETDVLGEGHQTGTAWVGNLVLKGYGDPSLTAAELVSLAHQVAAAGIRHVSGRILGDESWFDARRTGLGWKAAVLPPRVACALGAHRQPRLDGPLRDGPPGAHGRSALPAAISAAQGSRSTGARRSASPLTARSSSQASSLRRSRRSSATWTCTATTSTRRCC